MRVVVSALVALIVVNGPVTVLAGPIVERALQKARAAVPLMQQSPAGSAECLLAANAGTAEGSAGASFRYFRDGLIMPFYAISRANRSSAEPPAELLSRYPGPLATCFSENYRDARRRARAQTAFYGSLLTTSLVLGLVVLPAILGGSDDYGY